MPNFESLPYRDNEPKTDEERLKELKSKFSGAMLANDIIYSVVAEFVRQNKETDHLPGFGIEPNIKNGEHSVAINYSSDNELGNGVSVGLRVRDYIDVMSEAADKSEKHTISEGLRERVFALDDVADLSPAEKREKTVEFVETYISALNELVRGAKEADISVVVNEFGDIVTCNEAQMTFHVG